MINFFAPAAAALQSSALSSLGNEGICLQKAWSKTNLFLSRTGLWKPHDGMLKGIGLATWQRADRFWVSLPIRKRGSKSEPSLESYFPTKKINSWQRVLPKEPIFLHCPNILKWQQRMFDSSFFPSFFCMPLLFQIFHWLTDRNERLRGSWNVRPLWLWRCADTAA